MNVDLIRFSEAPFNHTYRPVGNFMYVCDDSLQFNIYSLHLEVSYETKYVLNKMSFILKHYALIWAQ